MPQPLSACAQQIMERFVADDDFAQQLINATRTDPEHRMLAMEALLSDEFPSCQLNLNEKHRLLSWLAQYPDESAPRDRQGAQADADTRLSAKKGGGIVRPTSWIW